jgi:hypothetical protein
MGYFQIFMVMLPVIIGIVIGGRLSMIYGVSTVIDGKPGMVPEPVVFQVAGIATLFAHLPLTAVRRKNED